MMIVGSSVPRIICYNLLPLLGAPLYYATPENEWAELIQPYIQPWLVPQDFAAIKYLYEGLPEGEAIPWGAWVRPLFFWLLFLAALYLVMISVMVILRKQWAEHERLVYPLVQIPLVMVEEGDRRIFGPFFRSKMMWLGFSIPFIVGAYGASTTTIPFSSPRRI